MKLAQAFDTIEVGEVDDFAFNITTRMGRALIVSTKFTCTMTPYSDGADPNPPSRVVEESYSNNGIYYRAADGSIQFLPGFFAIVRLGPMPASAAGGTYIIDYQAFLDDSRIIQDSTTLPCALPGQ